MNKKLVGLFVLICVLIGVSRKYNLFSMNESDIQKVKEYHERLKAAQEDPKAQEKLREHLEKVGIPVRRSVKQPGRCPLGKEFVYFLLEGGPIVLKGHNIIWSIAFSPDGRNLATGGDKTAKLWDASTGNLLRTLAGHTDSVDSVAFSPDGSKIATGSWDKSAKLWDVNTGQLLHTLTGHTDWVRSVVFSPDGSKIATGSSDYTVKLWDVETGNLLKTLTGIGGSVSSVSFSPNGNKLIVKSFHPRVKGGVDILDVDTGEFLHHFGDFLSAAAFSLDGSKLVTASIRHDEPVQIWDVDNAKVLRALENQAEIESVVFSPDGTKLAVVAKEGVQIWDVGNGKALHIFIPSYGWLESVVFSPDGSKLVINTESNMIIWDLRSGDSLFSVPNRQNAPVVFSPDGSKLVTGPWGGMAKIWNIPRIDRLTELRAEEIKEKGKNLTKEPTISLQRFLKVLPNKECEKDPEYCNIMSVEQCELLQAFENTFKKDQAGRPVGRIQATQAQWQTFKTLPEVLQEILRVRIKEPVEFVYQ